MASYREQVQGWPLQFLVEPIDCRSAYHLGVVTIPQATQRQHRALFEGMRTARIGVQLHYWPIHLQPHYRRLGFQPGQFPAAERYATTSFSLPLFPAMTEADQQRVLFALHRLLQLQGLV